MEPETEELLNRPGFCRGAICPDCKGVLAVAVWDGKTSKDTKKEFAKMLMDGYEIVSLTLKEARSSLTFHHEGCPRDKRKSSKKK